MRSREVRLRTAPTGAPRESDFEVADTELPALPAGHVLVRTLFASVDPYQRNRMRSGLRPGDAIPARCIGEVVESRSDSFGPGDVLFIAGGAWRDHLVCDAGSVARLDPDLSPPQIHLGAAGIPGLTAYVGLLLHGAPKAGETVFVSAAAGAVGSLACQIAKAQGCRVVGSAGSDEKVAWLIREARVDAAFNYKASDLAAEMRRCCPEGIDLLFESVGGAQLDAAIAAMRPRGRIVLCGLIGSIDATAARPGIADLDAFISKRLRLQGFVVTDHLDRMPAFHADLKRWLAAGAVVWRETVVDGLENAPRALMRLLAGDKEGKMLVRVAAPIGA